LRNYDDDDDDDDEEEAEALVKESGTHTCI
jgi:hypothetical protein